MLTERRMVAGLGDAGRCVGGTIECADAFS